MKTSLSGWLAAITVWAAAPAVAAEITWSAPIWGPKRASSESLVPDNAQKAMLEVRRGMLPRFEELYTRENSSTVAAMKQQGVEFTTFSSTEREKQGLKGREVFEFTQAKIREFTRK